MRYQRKRDSVEQAIVAAFRAAGASVQRIDAAGAPDLVVGFRGVNFWVECKDVHGKAYGHGKRTADGLLDSQRAWWAAWRGRTPVIVTTVDEAFAAIGLVLDE
jgi:hypothetical protein